MSSICLRYKCMSADHCSKIWFDILLVIRLNMHLLGHETWALVFRSAYETSRFLAKRNRNDYIFICGCFCRLWEKSAHLAIHYNRQSSLLVYWGLHRNGEFSPTASTGWQHQLHPSGITCWNQLPSWTRVPTETLLSTDSDGFRWREISLL